MIDAHALYWWLEESIKLPSRVRQRIESELVVGGSSVSAVRLTVT